MPRGAPLGRVGLFGPGVPHDSGGHPGEHGERRIRTTTDHSGISAVPVNAALHAGCKDALCVSAPPRAEPFAGDSSVFAHPAIHTGAGRLPLRLCVKQKLFQTAARPSCRDNATPVAPPYPTLNPDTRHVQPPAIRSS